MVTFYMMQGLAGSGKSFIAQRIAEETRAEVISSDALAKETTASSMRYTVRISYRYRIRCS